MYMFIHITYIYVCMLLLYMYAYKVGSFITLLAVWILCFDLISMLSEHFFKLIMDIPLGLLLWQRIR